MNIREIHVQPRNPWKSRSSIEVRVILGCLIRYSGTKTLAEILSERETICHVMEHILDEATRPWGVKVRHQIVHGVKNMSSA